jgi:ubiquinone/menaquinone biosynthesis C-methylase UbiE
MMNYFNPKSVAERYARGRLYFHPLIVGRIKEFLSITELLSSALDVGCGTGLSTIALKEIARSVTGVDASAEMVALAPEVNGVRFLVARAENLPFDKGEFDLVTLSQVFHWLDRDKFLVEAKRVLRPNGWLVVYDDYFSVGQMAENPEFQRWYREKYLARYPTPPRAEITFTEENTERYGLRLLKEEWHEHSVGFSLEGLIDYLVTQSNVIAVVEGEKEEIEEAKVWLMDGIKSIFSNAKERKFLFNAPIWYLQSAT